MEAIKLIDITKNYIKIDISDVYLFISVPRFRLTLFPGFPQASNSGICGCRKQ